MAKQTALALPEQDTLLPLVASNRHLLQMVVSVGSTMSGLSTSLVSIPDAKASLENQIEQFIQYAETSNEQLTAGSGALVDAMIRANTLQINDFAPLLVQLQLDFAEASGLSGEFADLLRDVLTAMGDVASARLALHEELQSAQADRSFRTPG